jgi:hypothetical protein
MKATEPSKPFASLAPEIRALAISRGIVRKVAAETGYTRGAVSVTFSGDVKTPNPRIVEALRRKLRELTSPEVAA